MADRTQVKSEFNALYSEFNALYYDNVPDIAASLTHTIMVTETMEYQIQAIDRLVEAIRSLEMALTRKHEGD